MTKLFAVAGSLLLVAILYLLLWPVPIDPVAWEAPADRGLVDPYAPNDLVVLRLPEFLHPEADIASHVIAFNGDGEVLMNLQDPEARYPTLTGVLETRRNLYLTTLYGNVLPVLAGQDL